MLFRLLGAVRAQAGDQVVSLGPSQQRLVFAVLALEVNRLVLVDRLVDLVWPQSPPRSAVHAIQVSVSGLRRLLAGTEGVRILNRGSSYCLETDPLRVDVHRFRALVGQARECDRDDQTVALLDQALELWTGPPLADVATAEIRERLCGDLEELRLVAVEDRVEARLNLGAHRDLLAELHALVRAHPARERLVGQLMLALHRGGQTGRALETLRVTRAHLAEELGIDPGDELRRLEVAILRNDPGLSAPTADPASATGPDENISPPVRPAHLPPDIADFTGRDDQLRRLDELAAARPDRPNSVVLSAIAGTAGVGKTALAVHWAHRVRDRFPDGQLYMDLRGYAMGPPLHVEQALSRLLRSMGVPPERIPADVDDATAMYRSALADKRMLVLLDNAASAALVRPLLPAGPGCVVVITSRDRLDGLVATDGVRRLTLDVLSTDEAIRLLRTMLGDGRVEREHEAATELIGLCAHLPLALRICAAHLINQPHRTIADHVDELRHGDVLESLQIAGDERAAVRIAFGLSYASLDADARRLFRLLGLIPGPDFGLRSAAALTGQTPTATARLLDRLAAAHLVDQPAPGRHGVHDLLRRYARERARIDDSDMERAAAAGRLYDDYLHGTRAAAELLYPQMLRLPVPVLGSDSGPSEPDDHAEAAAWLDRERANLVAAVHEARRHGPPRMAALLADALRGYFHQRREFVDWFAVARTALQAAEAEHEPSAQAAAWFSLGTAHLDLSRYPEAADNFTAALALSREAGWRIGEAAALTNLGLIDEHMGDLEQAAARHTRALALDRQVGARHHEVTALINLGLIDECRGRLAAAADRYRDALTASRDIGARHIEGYALDQLGSVYHLLGRLDEALEHCAQALALYRQLRTRDDQARVLVHLAAVHRDAGRLAVALDHARDALTLSIETGEGRAIAAARVAVAAALHATGGHREAIELYEQACRDARALGARYEHCQAMVGLAESRLGLGRTTEAVANATQARSLARDTGYRLIEGQALTAAAEIHAYAGAADQAADCAREAVAIHDETGHRPGRDRALAVLKSVTMSEH